MHQWHWGKNATRRRSQGVTLTCDGHWKAHKLQDDDGQTKTSVSWAGRPPSLPGRLEMPTVDGAATAFACRSAALHLSVSCHFGMNDCSLLYPSKPSAGFCASFRHPSNFIPKADIPSFTYYTTSTNNLDKAIHAHNPSAAMYSLQQYI